MGWGMLPTYVGPQAPCWAYGKGVLITRQGGGRGAAAGADAVS